MDTYRGAWHGDPDLKAATVAKMKQHRVQDEFIQRDYLRLDPTRVSGYRGCAIGCLVGQTSRVGWGWHTQVDAMFAIPLIVSGAIDRTFECQEGVEAAGDFAVAVLEAIPVGADLQRYRWGDFSHEGDDAEALIEQLATTPLVGDE